MYSINFIKELRAKCHDGTYTPKQIHIKQSAPSLLRRSFKMRIVDAGDDEATMAELYALEWPHFSMESYGIFVTASPKHADAIMVVWAVTQNMMNALKSSYDLTPSPKVIIACWDRAIHGDPRFPEVVGWAKDVLWSVDLEIPWNPPSARDILDHLVSYLG